MTDVHRKCTLPLANDPTVTDWLGVALDLTAQAAPCRCGASAIQPWCDGSPASSGRRRHVRTSASVGWPLQNWQRFGDETGRLPGYLRRQDGCLAAKRQRDRGLRQRHGEASALTDRDRGDTPSDRTIEMPPRSIPRRRPQAIATRWGPGGGAIADSYRPRSPSRAASAVASPRERTSSLRSTSSSRAVRPAGFARVVARGPLGRPRSPSSRSRPATIAAAGRAPRACNSSSAWRSAFPSLESPSAVESNRRAGPQEAEVRVAAQHGRATAVTLVNAPVPRTVPEVAVCGAGRPVVLDRERRLAPEPIAQRLVEVAERTSGRRLGLPRLGIEPDAEGRDNLR
jgi:hypothetical protein